MSIEELVEMIKKDKLKYAVISCNRITSGVSKLKSIEIATPRPGRKSLVIKGEMDEMIDVVLGNIEIKYETMIDEEEKCHIIKLEKKNRERSLSDIEITIGVL